MLNAGGVNLGKSELQEVEYGLCQANWSCKFQERPFLGPTVGNNTGGQIRVLNLSMCTWYQSGAVLCPEGKRHPGKKKELSHS
jgi:hypothetical protein